MRLTACPIRPRGSDNHKEISSGVILTLHARSGTEEQHNEKHHLLEGITELAREASYRIRQTVAKKVTSSHTPLRVEAATERCNPSVARDGAATAVLVEQNASVTPLETGRTCATNASTSQADVSHDSSNVEQLSCDLAPGDTVISLQSAGSSHSVCSSPPQPHNTQPEPCHATTEESSQQGRQGTKRKECDDSIAFFERLLQYEKSCKEKEFELEKRRLTLEENHLALEWEKLEQRKREWEAEREEKAEERRLKIEELAERRQQHEEVLKERAEERQIFLEQQHALLEVIKSLIPNGK
ncbi:uncharacterized protein LOC135385258 isoform X2 [Ornithodoros turicata]|uniref:uncharacterized protein LOC135385258 isoform X2 n=1 Tax=Ornithodoros turicata TaxID=34597 RepID=UPI00313984AF